MRRNREAGYVLVLVIVMLMLIFGMGMLVMQGSFFHLRRSAQHLAKTKTFYSAEGALNQGLAEIKRGFRDPTHERYVAFDPVDPEKVFRLYVDDPERGLKKFTREGTYLMEDRGLGSIDYKISIADVQGLFGVQQEALRVGVGPEGLLTRKSRYGREIALEGSAQHPRGAKATVQQRIILSYLPSVIFKYGMLTNRLKECQFCHMHILGDIGQVSGANFAPISPHVTTGLVQGNFFLTGSYDLDKHPAHVQLLTVQGKIFEHNKDPRKMPREWPSILQYDEFLKPSLASFYLELTQQARLNGQSRLSGGRLLTNTQETDRFKRVEEIAGIYDGNLFAEGSADLPLEINGPLVIKGDLMLRGTIRGQGALYVERNIYLIDDVVYATQPNEQEWLNVAVAEEQRRATDAKFRFDRLGLFAGGNVIIGNLAHPDAYNYVEQFLNYESSGLAVERFEKEGSYDPRGLYAMDGGAGRRRARVKYFHYNDRFEDGSDYDRDGKKAWGEGMRFVAKPDTWVETTGLLPKGSGDGDFAGGWISRLLFNEFAQQGAKTAAEKINQVRSIDATIYTDGAFTGYKPSNDRGKSELLEYKSFGDQDGDGLTFHGAVIARDIDVLAPGGWYVVYDTRNYVGQGSSINFEPSRVVELSGWREVVGK